MWHSSRSLVPHAAFLICLLPIAPSAALDVSDIWVAWVGAGGSYFMDAGVGLEDATGLDEIRVTHPGGQFSMVPPDFEMPANSFTSSALLFADFPGGTWTFEFLDDADAVLDSFSRSIPQPDEVTESLQILQPMEGGTIQPGESVQWSPFSSATATHITGFGIDHDDDVDFDCVVTDDLATTQWQPSGLVSGHQVSFEMYLAQYSTARDQGCVPSEGVGLPDSTTGGDPIFFAAGFERVSEVTATVPEPGHGAQLAAGIAALGLLAARRRGRAASQD